MLLNKILFEIVEKKTSQRHVNKLYSYYTSEIEKRGINVDGGNCGQYALAMSKFLHSQYGIETKIWFIAPNPTKDNDEYRDCGDFSIDEFENGDIYHVFLEYYDYPVGISISGLRKSAIVQYNDSDPCFHGSSRNNPTIIQIIENDTDWNIHHSKFYNILVSLLPNDKKQKL